MRLFQDDCDVDLSTKVLTLILAAMDASDADAHADLRQQFLKKLLQNGKPFCANPVPRLVRKVLVPALCYEHSCKFPVLQLSSKRWHCIFATVLTAHAVLAADVQ